MNKNRNLIFLLVLALACVGCGGGGGGSSTDPGNGGGTGTVYSHYLYAVSPALTSSDKNGKVYAFGVSANGRLTRIGTYPAGELPLAVAATPGGKFLYVINNDSPSISGGNINTVSIYGINNDGTLRIINSEFPIGADPKDIAISPDGKFAYLVRLSDSNPLSGYSIDALNGSLSPIAGFTAPSGLESSIKITISSVGYFPPLYFALIIENGLFNKGPIRCYNINSNTGVITTLLDNYDTGLAPSDISAIGNLIYVANGNNSSNPGANSISGYKLVSSGLSYNFTDISGSPWATDKTSPTSVAMTPDRKYLYAVCKNGTNGHIAGFNINTSGNSTDSSYGILTPLTGTSWAAGDQASFIRLHPDGTYAYVSFFNNSSLRSSIKVFGINANGTMDWVQDADSDNAAAILALTVVKK